VRFLTTSCLSPAEVARSRPRRPDLPRPGRHEHVRKTVHLTVRIDREEPLDRLRQAVDPRPTQPWQCDDAVGGDRSLGDEAQLPLHQLDRGGCRVA
jgi:hypothetical protein